MKTLSNEDLVRIMQIVKAYECGEPIETEDLNYFLKVTHEFDRVLRAMGPEYRLVANSIAGMRSNMQRFIDFRKRSF